MMTDEILAKYEMTIGIECHTQLKTKTKLFSGASNDANDAAPNTCISPICLGLPGVLPVLNEQALVLGVKAGLALNSKINLVSKFDRKHYFYPDLPKGYQITQLYEPIVGEGEITIILPSGDTKQVGITRAHLEEDAGKSTHGSDASYVDLNRAGTPLLEIVSDPDMHSSAEARAYAHTLYLLMKYANVSDVDLYHGNMRFDVNLSVALRGSTQLGTRAEVKNLNSFRSVEKAAEYEFKRQVEILENGEKVVQETRGWDDTKMKTSSQRGKEEAHDYRYMPEPDVPPVILNQNFVDEIKAKMPKLPNQLRQTMLDNGIDKDRVEMLLEDPELANFVVNLPKNEQSTITNWLTTEISRAVTANELTWNQVVESKQGLLKLAEMFGQNKLSSTAAKDMLKDVINGNDPEKLATERNLLQVSDEGAIEKIVAEVLSENEKAATDVKNGEMKAIGFLVGQVMAKSKGQANPGLAQKIIKTQLSL